MSIPFSDYLTIAWFLSNLITGLGYFWVSYEIHGWTRDLPDRRTGFRTLARLFEVFIFVCGIHHLVMATLVWDHPTPLYMVLTDMVVALSSGITAASLYLARDMVKRAFATMLRHNEEWRAANPDAE